MKCDFCRLIKDGRCDWLGCKVESTDFTSTEQHIQDCEAKMRENKRQTLKSVKKTSASETSFLNTNEQLWKIEMSASSVTRVIIYYRRHSLFRGTARSFPSPTCFRVRQLNLSLHEPTLIQELIQFVSPAKQADLRCELYNIVEDKPSSRSSHSLEDWGFPL